MVEIKRIVIELPAKDHYSIKRRALDRGMSLKKYVIKALLSQIAKEEGILREEK